MSKFPASVNIVVGPGFKKNLLPGYPSNPESALLESDYSYVRTPLVSLRSIQLKNLQRARIEGNYLRSQHQNRPISCSGLFRRWVILSPRCSWTRYWPHMWFSSDHGHLVCNLRRGRMPFCRQLETIFICASAGDFGQQSARS